MQFNAAHTPAEIAEAQRLAGGRAGVQLGWRLLLVNWYATLLLVFAVGLVVVALAAHRQPDWRTVGIFVALAAFRFGLSWSRRNASAKLLVSAGENVGGVLTLDSTGVTTQLLNGSRSFLPWSSFTAYTLGEHVFVLTGKGVAVAGALPAESRELVRGSLLSYMPAAAR